MPFDGNGNWTSNFNAEADRDAGYKILASRFDNILLADLAQSFENCLTKDTQVKPQQNFNANNYRVINVADPVDYKDAVNKQTMDTEISTADATAVHIAGEETITGDKTFSGTNTFTGSVALNGTISGSNSVKETITGWGMPDYSAGVAWDSGMVASKNIYVVVELGGDTYQGGYLYVNGVAVARGYAGYATAAWVRLGVFVKKGDTVTVDGQNSNRVYYPLIGG